MKSLFMYRFDPGKGVNMLIWWYLQ